MANTMEHLDDISRTYVAKKAVQYGFVREVGRREDVSKTMFSEPTSDLEFLNAAIRKYHLDLGKFMSGAGLSDYESMAFLAAEAIGMGLAQKLSFSVGNIILDKENSHWARVDNDGPMAVIGDSFFRETINKSIETAFFSDKIFDKPKFEAWMSRIVGYNLRRDNWLYLFDHVKAMKILTGDVCMASLRK